MRSDNVKRHGRGARVKRVADLNAQDFSAGAALNWTALDFDTDAFWNSAVNPNRLTTPVTPVGLTFTKCRVDGGVYLNNITAASLPVFTIRKNGTIIAYQTGDNPGTTWGGTISSGIIPYNPGDYFDLFFQCTDTSIDFLAVRSFFSIELID